MDIELNDTKAVRRELISLVEEYYEYDGVHMDDVIQCLHDNGYLTYEYEKEDKSQMESDRTAIIYYDSFHDRRALDLYHGSFMMFIILNLLNNPKNMGNIMYNKYWKLITNHVTL